MTVKEYYEKKEILLTEYEKAVREWLSKDFKRPNGRKTFKGNPELAEKIPFFRDGVVCPEVWFEKGNDFRPLIILKEVSIGKNKICELDDYLKEWCNTKQFEFVENPFDDVRVGTFSQWARVAKLIKTLEATYNNENDFDYNKYNLSFESSKEYYSGNIDGYKDKDHFQRTGNKEYRRITDRMAIMEMKKVAGGQDVGSELSTATRHYTDHIAPFKEFIEKQIELINPTVIIFCGREYGGCIRKLFEDNGIDRNNRIWIDGYHHILSSNEHFFDEPVKAYKKSLNG